MHNPQRQDVEAEAPKLPGGAVDIHDPRLGNVHLVDHDLGDRVVVNFEAAKEPL